MMTGQNLVNHDQPKQQHGAVKEAPAVSVLIVGYNTKDLVLQCLEGLFDHTTGIDFEVLFVDNSSDGSEQAIRERFPQVRVIDNDQNLGFGRGNNFLARHATGKYLLLLNPDTVVQDNAIGNLHYFAEQHPECGAWGGITRLPDGSIDPGCKQPGVGFVKSLLMLMGMAEFACPKVEAATKAMDVPSLSGAFMMLPRALWDDLAGFDETFFMYAEETDLCYRVRLTGRRVMITPDASVVHLVGSGASQSPKRMLALTRGDMHFARKHFGPVRVFAFALIRWLYSLSRYLLGVIALPLVGSVRAAELRKRHAPIISNPGQWVHGWSDPLSPVSQAEAKHSKPMEPQSTAGS